MLLVGLALLGSATLLTLHLGLVLPDTQLLEKGSAIITHVQGNEVHAMDNKTYSNLILPLEEGLNLQPGGEIQWVEAMGRYKITRDH